MGDAPPKGLQSQIRAGLKRGVIQEAPAELLGKLSKRGKYAYKAFMERPVWRTMTILNVEGEGTWCFSPLIGFKLDETETIIMKLISGSIRTVWKAPPDTGYYKLTQATPDLGTEVTLEKSTHDPACSYRALLNDAGAFEAEVSFPAAGFLNACIKDEKGIILKLLSREDVANLYSFGVKENYHHPILVAFNGDTVVATATVMGTDIRVCTMKSSELREDYLVP